MRNQTIDLTDSDNENYLPTSIPLTRSDMNPLTPNNNILSYIGETTQPQVRTSFIELDAVDALIQLASPGLSVSRRLVNNYGDDDDDDSETDVDMPELIQVSNPPNSDEGDDIIDVTDHYINPVITELNALISDWLTEEQMVRNRRNAYEQRQILYREQVRSIQVRC
jgi:hypothetical protein